MTKRPIDYRSTELLLGILGAVYDDEDPTLSVLEDALVAELAAAHNVATVRRAIRELIDFGALRRLTPLREEPRLRMTALGHAWVDRRLEPYLAGLEEEHVDVDTEDPDPGESGP